MERYELRKTQKAGYSVREKKLNEDSGLINNLLSGLSRLANKTDRQMICEGDDKYFNADVLPCWRDPNHPC
jgi:hypothetical protein